MSEDLKELRVKIDSIDTQLVELFKQRMAVSRDIAAYKKEHSLPTLDAGRERALLAKVGTQAGEELAEYTESVFRSILAAGRSYQNQRSGVKSQVYETIRRALDTTPDAFLVGTARPAGEEWRGVAELLRGMTPKKLELARSFLTWLSDQELS